MPDARKMPDLSNLSIAELHDLSNLLAAIYRGASTIDAAGWPLRIDLTPGVGPRLITEAKMPMVGPQAAVSHIGGPFAGTVPKPDTEIAVSINAARDIWSEAKPFDQAGQIERGIYPTPAEIPKGRPVPSATTALPPAEGPEATAAAPVAVDKSAEDAAEAVAEGKGPEAEAPTHAPAATPSPVAGGDGTPVVIEAAGPGIPQNLPAPGSVRALAASSRAETWTGEEDARLVAIVVRLVRAGHSKASAGATAAQELGRPSAGTAFRVNHKLKSRIEEALNARDAVQAGAAGPGQADTAEAAPTVLIIAEGPETQAAAEAQRHPVVEAIAAVAAEVRNLASDPLTAHLLALPRVGPKWSLKDDAEILKLAIEGWKPHEIALEMQIGSRELQSRFDLLTGFDPDTRRRRWPRDEVFARLLALIAGKAA